MNGVRGRATITTTLTVRALLRISRTTSVRNENEQGRKGIGHPLHDGATLIRIDCIMLWTDDAARMETASAFSVAAAEAVAAVASSF